LKFILLIIFCFCLSCTGNSDNNWDGKIYEENGVSFISNKHEGIWAGSYRMDLQQQYSIGNSDVEESELILNYPWGMAVDRKGNLYICDGSDNCVKKFNENGVFQKVIGHVGQGPGEFISPMQIDIIHDSLLCIASQFKINYFDLDGGFISSFMLKNIRAWDIAYLSANNNLVVSNVNFPGYAEIESEFKAAFFELNRQGEILDKYGNLVLRSAKSKFPDYSCASLTTTAESDLIVSFWTPYLLNIYDSKLKLKKVITREFEHFDDYETIKYRGEPYLRTRFNIVITNSLPDGKLLVTIRDSGYYNKEDEKKTRGSNSKIIYDLYDNAGCFLQSFENVHDCNEHITYVDRAGFAYTISGPEEIPMVKKYKLSFFKQ